jgi:2-polyprenyl-3-methyl-5-hydroxy-6-metoxy-1,4-benzoquinol methylase
MRKSTLAKARLNSSSGGKKPAVKEKGQITGLFSPLLEEWRLSKVVRYLSGDRILDYGCGHGALASRVGGREYVGVDRNEDVLVAARSRFHDSPNIRFSSPGQFFASDQGRFDTIVLAAVLEHLEDPEEELAALKRLLAEHGKIVITTPTRRADMLLGLGSRFHLFSAEAHEEHVQFFDKSAFSRLAEKTGLKLQVFSTFQCGLNQLVVYTNG